jgi:hypothetical protein
MFGAEHVFFGFRKYLSRYVGRPANLQTPAFMNTKRQ